METAGASSNGDTTVAEQAVLLESAQSGGVASAPSPLTGCYLLIVIGEPHSQEHKDIILQRMAKGFLSWDKDDCHVDLEKELQILTTQAPEGEEAKYGERLIQYASENLVTEVLIHPAFSTLAQCMRNLLSSFTRHRHIIHAGYTFAGNGSWILQDGTFSHADFCDSFQEHEVQRVIRAYENTVTVDIHCSPEGEWPRLPKESFTKHCKVRINPTDVLTSGSPAITAFVDYIAPFLNPVSLDTLLESSDVVGNIRFSHPTLYVFPGGQGDAALFGINGFNMLVDGGFNRKACFWDFTRHLDRLDAVLVTRINNSNISGISAVLQRKRHAQVYPQIGHFFCNIQERKTVLSPDGDKDKDPLLISLIDEGHDLVSNLRALNLRPQGCYRDSDPINLYHKVGHGTLDMYVLNPAKDTKEVKEFLQKWYQNDQKLFTTKKDYGDCQFPVQNLVSICVLLVWQPANPDDTITRILFPGSAPQYKIFEGLDKLKHLEFMKRPTCTAKTLSPAGSTIGLKTRQNKTVLEKILPEQKKIQPTIDNKQQLKDTSPQTNENKQKIENKKITENRVRKAQPRSATIKSLKSDDMKSESFESDKDDSKGDDIKKIESNQVAEKNELNKPKSEHRSKIDTIKSTAKSRTDMKHGKSVDRKTARNLAEKKASADVKSSPTTPKKTLESKVNGTIKEKEITKMRSNKLSNKQSPSSTPAKSTKDANNRKVIESKYKTPSIKKEPMKATEKKDVTKPERKPISHRPKGTSPSRRPPGSPAKSAKSTPSIKSEKDAVIRKIKLDKEGTTDSSTVSTPSADQDTILKKIEEGKLTKEEIEALKAQELADLKEEQEVVKEIEAVFNKDEKKELKAELEDIETRKIADSTETEAEATEPEETEEYIIIEKEEIEPVTEDSAKEQESTAKEEDEIQKHLRDSEDSEKRKKEIAEIEEGRTELQKVSIEENEIEPTPEEEPKEETKEKEVKIAGNEEVAGKKDKDAEEKQKVDESITPEHKDQIQNEVQDIIKSATEIIKSKDDIKEKTEEMSKDVSTTSPEDKVDVSSEKKTTDTKDNEDVDVKEPGEPGVYAAESQPDEKLSTTFESGATTAPTLPEDERITLDDIKEDNVDQGIEEKHVKEETKEKEIPISIEPTKFEPSQPPPTAVSGIQFDAHAAHQTHLRDIVKTPDEVADLPVHEEADMDMYDDFPGYKKDTKKTEEGQEDIKEKPKTPEHKVDEATEKEKVEDKVTAEKADKEEKLDEKLIVEKTAKDEKVTEENIVKEHEITAEKTVDKEEVPKKDEIHDVEEKVTTEEQKDEILKEIVKDQPKDTEIINIKHEKDEEVIEDTEEKNKTSPKEPCSRKESLKMELQDHESGSRKESLVTEGKEPATGKENLVLEDEQTEQKPIVEEKAPESRKESLVTNTKEEESHSRKESLISDEKISETRKQSEENESKSRKESLVTTEKESESRKESLEEKESTSRKESMVIEDKESEIIQEKEEIGSRKQSLKIEDEKPSSRKSSVTEEKEAELKEKEKIEIEEKESKSRKSSLIQQEIESAEIKKDSHEVVTEIVQKETSEKQEFIIEKESIQQPEIDEEVEQQFRKESLKLEEELKKDESKPEVSISRKESLVCEEKEQPSPKEPSSRKDSLVTDKITESESRKESLKADSEEKEIEKSTSRRESLKLDLDKEGSKDSGSRKQSLKLDISDEKLPLSKNDTLDKKECVETSKEVESDLQTEKDSEDIDEKENEPAKDIKDEAKEETYSRAQTIELKESYIGVQPTSDETKDNIIDEKTDEQISAICDIKVEEDLVVKHTLHKPDHAEIVTVTPDMTPDSPRFITKTTTDEAKESQSDEKCVTLEFETPYSEYGYVTTELRETHITTVESPIRDDLGKSFGHESPKATMRSFLDEERKLSSLHLTDKIDEEQDEEEEQSTPQEKKISSLLEESKALMDSTSKIISGIKSSNVSSVSETKSTGEESENQQAKSETDKESEKDDKKQEDSETSIGRTVDVLKIVASVADVLKSDKPLHEFDDIEWQDLKAPIQVSSTTEENKGDDKISEKNTIETPQDIESDIKKELKEDLETEASSLETSDKGTVKRMLVTASSEDGGLETEICPTGSIIFSQTSREGSGRNSPDIKEDISSSDGHDKLGDISNDVTPEPTVLSEKDSSGKSSPGMKDTSRTSTPDIQQEKEKEAVGSEISSRKSSIDVQDKTASSKHLESVKDVTSGKGTPDITDADDITSGKSSPDLISRISRTSISEVHDEKVAVKDISRTSTPESKKEASGTATPDIKSTSEKTVENKKSFEKDVSEKTSPAPSEPRLSAVSVSDIAAVSTPKDISRTSTPEVQLKEPIESGKASPTPDKISSGKTSPTPEKSESGKGNSTVEESDSEKNTETTGTKSDSLEKDISEKDRVSRQTSPTPEHEDSRKTSLIQEKIESGKASPAPSDKIESGKESPMPEKEESRKTSLIEEKIESGTVSPALAEKIDSEHTSPIPEKIESGKHSPAPEKEESRKTSLISEKSGSGKESPAPSDKLESGKATPDHEKIESGKASPTLEKGSRKTSLTLEKTDSGKVSPVPSDKIESGKTSPVPEKMESGKASPVPVKDESRKTSLISEKSGSGKESPAPSDKLESGKTTPAPEKIESGKASPAPEKEDSRKPSLTPEKAESGKTSPVPDKMESGKASPAPGKDESRKTSLISEKSGSGKESPAPSDKLESGKTSPAPEKEDSRKTSLTPEKAESGKTSPAPEKIDSGKASPTPEKEDSRKSSLTHEKVESGKTSPAPSDKMQSSPVPEKEESRKTSLISEKSGSGKTSPALSDKLIESGKASPIHEKTETEKGSSAQETKDLRKPSLKSESTESGKTSPAPFDKIESGKTSPAPEKIDSGKISPTPEKDESRKTSLTEKIESGKVSPVSFDKSGKSSPEKVESGKVSPIDEKTDLKEIEKCSPEPEKIESEKSSSQLEKTDINKTSPSETNLKDISRTSTPVQKLVDSKESSRTGTPDIKPKDITERLISSETSGKSTPDIPKSGKSSPGLESHVTDIAHDVKEISRTSTPEIKSIEKLDELTISKVDLGDLPTKEELTGKTDSSEKDVDTTEKSTKVDKTDSSKSEKIDSEKIDVLKKATIQEISQNGINGVLDMDNGIDFIEESSKESVTVSKVEKATSKIEPSEKSEIITTTSTTVTTIVTDKDGKQTTTVTKETTDSDGKHTTVTKETSEDNDKKMVTSEKTEETKNDTEVPEISIDGEKIDSHTSPTHMYEVTTAKYTTGSPDLQANGHTSPDLRPGSQTSGRSTPEIKIDLDVDLDGKEMKLGDDEDDISVEPTDLDKPGPSTAKDITKHSSEDLHLSGKSTPDIAEVEKIKEMHEILKHEKHIPGRSTPPTVPVSPNIIKDKEDVFTMQTDDEKSLMTQSMYIASDQTENVEHTIVESSDLPDKLSTVTTITTTITTDKDGKQTTTVTKETTDDADKQSTTTSTETKGVHDSEDKQPATSSLEETVSKTDDAKEIFKQSSKESVTDDDKIIHAATAILNGTGASTETVTKKTTSSEILRSSTPGSDDYDAGGVSSPPSDMSSGQMSRIPHHWGSDERQGYSDEEDVPSSPLSITSHVAASPTSGNFNYEDIAGTGMTESFYPQKAMDTMSTSFYGSFPDEPVEEHKSTVTTVTTKTVTEYGLDSDKTTTVTKEEVTNEGGATKTTTTTTTVTKSPKHGEEASASGKEVKADPIESWGKPLGLPHPTDPRKNIMETSYYGEFSEESDDFDPIAKWGKPLGLPSPAPPASNDTVKTTPKKERKTTTSMLAAKNRMNDEKRRSESPGKFGKKINPVYMDLTYVPHHGNANYSYVDFFKRIRARYYVFSGIEPSKEVYNALLEAKMSWEDKDLEVTIIPTYDTDVLCYWVSENEEQLAKWKIDLSPSASRCTINLQDHETSCSAYRLEF